MLLLVLFQLLFVLALLVFLGEPLRAKLLKRVSMFSDLDFLQIFILDVFIGGFILFVLAALPFGLFSLPVTAGLTIFCAAASVIIHRAPLISWFKSGSSSKIDYFVKNRRKLTVYLLVFLMFLVVLSINLSALSSIIFGSVRDESIHSLYVQVISENHYIPFTLQPYLPEAIVYPQASHVIFTFAYYMTNLSVPQVILYVSVLFKGLSIFGAYFLGKKLGKTPLYGLGLSFIIAFISSWPLNVTWGANPFIVGFPLFLICLGLLYNLYRKASFTELALLGLLVGYNGALILSYFEAFTLTALMVFAYSLFIKPHSSFRHAVSGFGTVFLTSMIPLSFFIYRFIAVYPFPNHNIGLPSDIVFVSTNQTFFSQSLQWAFDNLSPYLLIKILMILFLAVFAILLLVTNEYKNDNDNIILVNRFAVAIFVSALVLSLVAFFLPVGADIISWGHQGILLSIPLSILTLNFFIKIVEAIRKGKFDHYAEKLAIPRIPKESKAALLIAIAVISLLVSPFIYYRFSSDTKNLTDHYNVYAVTSQGDYDLLYWMADNLTSNAVILVHPYEAGLFIPSVSHQKIIFPYTASCESASYKQLVHLISNNTINATTYQIMNDWNITHIFVGSNVAYSANEYSWWNPEVFIGNPNFQFVQNFSNSYLFKLDITNPQVSFFDDFEHAKWEQNGWSSNKIGYGVGNVTITGVNGSKVLTITAQSAPTVQNLSSGLVYFVQKTVFSQNTSDVMLSFNLDIDRGFGAKDVFAITVSNQQESKSIVLSTPGSAFQNYADTAVISGTNGVYSYNLSQLWQQKYGSLLPETAVLRFATYDFDGNKNVVHLDNVNVTSVPAV